MIGNYNLENILAAICIGNYFGVYPENISQAISEYIPQNNRSQLTKTEKNQLIVDTYNANPTSMEAALINFNEIKNVSQKAVLLGDMLELGYESKQEHLRIVELIDKLQLKAFLVGKEFSAINQNHQTFLSVDDFITWVKENKLTDYTLLIKGSHGIHLEKAIQYL